MGIRRVVISGKRAVRPGRIELNFECGCRFIYLYDKNENGIKKKIRHLQYADNDGHKIFGCSMGSGLSEKQKDAKKKGYFMKEQRTGLYWALHDRGLAVPMELFRIWNIKYPDVWNSETRYCKQKVFKFSYHVKSGEFLMAPPGIHHNIMILNYGKFKFREYVRGIFFREKNIIYLRMHERLEWLSRTGEVLRMNGLPKKIKITFGEKAAQKLAKDLEGL